MIRFERKTNHFETHYIDLTTYTNKQKQYKQKSPICQKWRPSFLLVANPRSRDTTFANDLFEGILHSFLNNHVEKLCHIMCACIHLFLFFLIN
jgi:hypothetical protein